MQNSNSLKAELDNLIQTDPQKWSFMQAGSPDGVWYWDLLEPENEWTNPQSWAMVGASNLMSRDIPTPVADAALQIDANNEGASYEVLSPESDFPSTQIVRYRHGNGSVVWAHCRVIAVRDEIDPAIRLVAAEINGPELSKSPELLSERVNDADAINADLRSFAYSISHDMKAPANTLQMLLEELQEEGRSEMSKDAQGLLDLSLETVRRMQRLVDDVLNYTRVTGMKIPFEPVELSACASNAMSNLRADIAQRDAQITISELPAIQGVETQMTLLFQNLLSNAIKFCPDHVTPCIDVACISDPNSDTFDILVRDNGIGIPAEGQSLIFEMFHRLHTHSAFAGTGLGLALCQRIALNHAGQITVSSQEGEGATFIVTLPRAGH